MVEALTTSLFVSGICSHSGRQNLPRRVLSTACLHFHSPTPGIVTFSSFFSSWAVAGHSPSGIASIPHESPRPAQELYCLNQDTSPRVFSTRSCLWSPLRSGHELRVHKRSRSSCQALHNPSCCKRHLGASFVEFRPSKVLVLLGLHGYPGLCRSLLKNRVTSNRQGLFTAALCSRCPLQLSLKPSITLEHPQGLGARRHLPCKPLKLLFSLSSFPLPSKEAFGLTAVGGEQRQPQTKVHN